MHITVFFQGYIIKKRDQKSDGELLTNVDFQPFLFEQHKLLTHEEFPSFNKAGLVAFCSSHRIYWYVYVVSVFMWQPGWNLNRGFRWLSIAKHSGIVFIQPQGTCTRDLANLVFGLCLGGYEHLAKAESVTKHSIDFLQTSICRLHLAFSVVMFLT